MFSRRTSRGPSTGRFHTAVCTIWPCQATSCGKPTFTESKLPTRRSVLTSCVPNRCKTALPYWRSPALMHTERLRSPGRGRERVVLVGDRPPPVDLAQADGEPQPLVRIAFELLGRATPQQRERESNVLSCRDVERLDLERSAGRLPIEEGRPGLAVGVDAADALLGRRDVEHDDVGRVAGEHGGHVAVVYCRGPALDQVADLLFAGHCGSSSLLVLTDRTRAGA